VFRVVQDQLRVSEGWVRCGRCAEVFNAIETLVEVDADLPPKGVSSQRVLDDLSRLAAASAVRPVGRQETPRPEPAPDPAPPLKTASEPVADPSVASAPAAITDPVSPSVASSPDAAPVSPAETIARPDFVHRAERAARWRRPGVRRALGAVGAAAALALAAQVLLEYRDVAAASWPALQAPLASVCRPLGCQVQAPRRIDALVVDSSGLVRADDPATYRFSLALRNRSAIAVAAPAVDLSLTDAQGGIVARRVVRLDELGGHGAPLAAGATVSLQAVLAGPERAVSGYTIEVFYP
jgi:predicted Zn finger-like uncharacterized protein